MPNTLIYTDGSCWMAHDSTLVKAAAAAIQISAEGHLLRSATAVLPSWLPHSASSAEHFAVAMAHELGGKSPLSIVTDCASVLALHHMRARLDLWKSPLAGLWTEVSEHSSFQKVGAHLTRAQAEGKGAGHLWQGNYMVDLIAQQALQNSMPPSHHIKDLVAKQKMLKDFLTGVASLLSTWPPGGNLFPKREATTTQGLSKIKHQRHEVSWSRIRQGWQCSACQAFKKSKKGLQSVRCKPFSTKILMMTKQAQEMGHEVWITSFDNEEQERMIFCKKCGMHTHRRQGGLKKLCPNTANHARLRQILQGIQPGHKQRFLKKPIKMPLAEERLPCNSFWVQADPSADKIGLVQERVQPQWEPFALGIVEGHHWEPGWEEEGQQDNEGLSPGEQDLFFGL